MARRHRRLALRRRRRPPRSRRRQGGGRAGLYESLKRLLELDDFAEVWPGHIGGSLCGGAGMSEKPGTTIGFERRFNRLLASSRTRRRSSALTGDLAPQPPNFKRIVALNRGPLLDRRRAGRAARARAPCRSASRPAPRSSTGATPGLRRGTRPGLDQRHHGRAAAVGTRAAWVVDPESEVVVTAETDEEARRLALLLEAVGFRRIAGLLAGGVAAWREAGSPLESTVAIDVPELAARLRRGDVASSTCATGTSGRRGTSRARGHLPYHDLGEGVPGELAKRRQAARRRLLGREPQLDRGLAPAPRGGRRRDPRRRRRRSPSSPTRASSSSAETAEEAAALATLRRAGRRSSAG